MRKRLIVIIGLLLASILSMGLFVFVFHADTTTANANIAAAPAANSAVEPQATNLASIADVVAAVRPSVVAINVQVTTFDLFNQPVAAGGRLRLDHPQ